jgi:hypothetical protein
MREEHIIELLDKVPLNQLSEIERSRISEHTVDCPACQRAFQSAQISHLLLRERAAFTTEPSPFFKTKVMAEIKEKGLKQAKPGPFSFLPLWKTAGVLVYSMAALVLLLGALTFFQTPAEEPDLTATYNDALTEWVVLGADSRLNDEMTYGQVLTDIYYPEGEREETDGKRQ